MNELLLGILVWCGILLLCYFITKHNKKVEEQEQKMTKEEKERFAIEDKKNEDAINFIVFLVMGCLIIFSLYTSLRYEYYVNDEASLLKHDRYKDKVCVIDIDKKSYAKGTDFFWKLCFRYRYLKNNEKHSLIRIDKFKQKAIYLTDEYKKYGFVED